MKKRRRIKKKVIKLFVLSLLIIIALIAGISNIKERIDYKNSYDYKLLQIGYSEKEIKEIKKLDNKQINKLLNKKYNKLIVKFMKQKYFIFSNLDKYIEYYKKSENDDLSYTISMINTKANYKFYDEKAVTKTKVEDGNLMLVNKYNNLTKEYTPTDLVDVKNLYAYGENQIKKEVYEKFIEMWTDAKKEDLSLIITSAYRTYDYQEKLWNSYSNNKGEKWADSVAARPGHSEHQTGLTLDIVTYGSKMNDFENTDEFKWLSENAHKYGFILRYPKDKEELTGYSYESWHYRYVGKDVATKIYKEKITFDEYYSYYIENKKD